MSNIFSWILFAFPVYLLINGKLGQYLHWADLAAAGSALSPGGVTAAQVLGNQANATGQTTIGGGGGLNPEVPGIGFPAVTQPGVGFFPP